MAAVLEALWRQAESRPDALAVAGPARAMSYRALAECVETLRGRLAAGGWRVLGLLADNGPGWALADLAAQAAGITLVPLPGFFSDRQLRHVVRDAGIEAVVTDSPGRVAGLLPPQTIDVLFKACSERPMWLAAAPRPARRVQLTGVAKVTYTSGTTGAPKGVCLTQAALDAVAHSLVEAAAMGPRDRHLAVLPLATLLENLGGLYAPLLAGAGAHLLPLEQVGLRGASGLDARRLHGALADTRASTAILIPQMLQALVEARRAGARPLPELRFVAVGGAPVAPALLAQAARAGLPAYEGYGLSECASVVAVNTPGCNRPGSVGRPLPHARLRIAADGELHVAGAAFEGYLAEDGLAGRPADGWLATGDLGWLDEDGYLYLRGRKKHLFITSFGRNVAPEWVERELTLQPAIAQAAVFGEARPWCTAVIVPAPGAAANAVTAAIAAANEALPDYARIGGWLCADAPFALANEQLTGTGRLRRDAIWRAYAARIEALYEEKRLTTEVTEVTELVEVATTEDGGK